VTAMADAAVAERPAGPDGPAGAAADIPPATGGGPTIAVLDSQESLGIGIWKVPFYRALKRAYPGCTITLIVAKRTLMAGGGLRALTAPYVDHVVEQAGIEKPLGAAARRLRALPRYDLVFDARTKVLRVIWARLFLRHGAFVSMLPGWWLSTRRRARPARSRHWVDRLMAMVELATGAPADWRGRIALPEDVRAAAAHLLPDGPVYVGLAPGAAGAYKVWPLDRFADLARRLTAAGRQPVFLIGPNEGEMVAPLRAAVPGALFPEIDRDDPHPEVRGPALALGLGERLSAAVCNCTGIGHLLANAGTPLVSLFGPTDPRRFLPWVEPVRALRAQDFGGGEAMEAIPVDAVAEAVEALIAQAARTAAAAGDAPDAVGTDRPRAPHPVQAR